MKNTIKSGDQLRALLEKIVSVSVKDAHKAINEASIPYLNEQEEAEEEEVEEEAEEEVEEETEEEAEEETEEAPVEADDEEAEEKDPMKRQPRKEPTRPSTGADVRLSHILYDINQIRSGRSLKDPEVKDNLKDYFDRLGKPERITLSEFLAGLTDVIVKGVPAEDAETPDEEVSITEPKKNQEKEADSEEEPSKEKPVEDTTPPIQVRR
tara:strand:- start:190 stop:819 length:630 start_codon:yes stop_codon:yes gene_type:complete